MKKVVLYVCSGQSPAMPAAGGRSQARHNATSPSQTGTLGRDLLVGE